MKAAGYVFPFFLLLLSFAAAQDERKVTKLADGVY
jgi:hypothetical protein